MKIIFEKNGDVSIELEKGERMPTRPEINLAINWGGPTFIQRLWRIFRHLKNQKPTS